MDKTFTKAFTHGKSNQHFVHATSHRKTIALDPENQGGGLQGFSSLFSSLRITINRARHHFSEGMSYASEVFRAWKTKENQSDGWKYNFICTVPMLTYEEEKQSDYTYVLWFLL